MDNAGELLFLLAVTLGPVALVQSTNAYEPLIILMVSFVLAKLFPYTFPTVKQEYVLTQKIFTLIGIVIISIGSIYLYTLI